MSTAHGHQSDKTYRFCRDFVAFLDTPKDAVEIPVSINSMIESERLNEKG